MTTLSFTSHSDCYPPSGQFCLTEIGHGLDAMNIETEATLQHDGCFVLHTPCARAAKFMPPTSPSGFPCVAVVMARLIVGGEDYGVQPFLVSLNNGQRMSPGIASKVLPPRGGGHYVEHCITSFSNVRLPHYALLGTLDKPKDLRSTFFASIDRVIVGTLSMAAICVPGLKVSAGIVAQYSKRRRVTDALTRLPRSIISFSTQQIPIITAISQALVFESFLRSCIATFSSPDSTPALRHCIAAIAKATILPRAQDTVIALSERCGAQGLFDFNRLTSMLNNGRGLSIAEGDMLVVSIRFAVEILLGRIELPPADQPDSVLARHEDALIQDLRGILFSASHHRAEESERLVLPRCQPLLEAIGFRIAYEAACKDQLNNDIINTFLSNCFQQDAAWYAESGGISLSAQRRLEHESVARLVSQLDELLKVLDVEEAAKAPIISDERWNRFMDGLISYDGAKPESMMEPRSVSHL
ncbi:hypothetical protein ONZ45_g12118 [Pleurotus djamor]|nr:hypothetical protein ONZ45_g12118 [Pleurotus djamor]